MAPKGRGGGGGGGGGGGLSGCPGAFGDSISVSYFIFYILWFLADVGILIAWGKIKKRHPDAKKLLGHTFFWAIFFLTIQDFISAVSMVLNQCSVGNFYAYFELDIALHVFFRIAEFLLLVVVVMGVINALRKRLGGQRKLVIPVVYGAALGIVAVIGATSTAINGYNLWTRVENAFGEDMLQPEGTNLGLAYRVLYWVTSLIGGGLSLFYLAKLRSQAPVNGLIVWVILLTLSMTLWNVISIGVTGALLNGAYLDIHASIAIDFITRFFFIVSFVLLLVVAKAPTFKRQAAAAALPTYSQPTYAQPAPQQYQPNAPQPYYPQQQPAQLPNNQPPYYTHPQLDGTQRHEVKA